MLLTVDLNTLLSEIDNYLQKNNIETELHLN